jgi:tRNA A-37 threonylcarbamoyl transferase component Bud32
MDKNQEVSLDFVLASMRETIGTQAQEIAVLKATIAALKEEKSTANS